MTGLEHPLKKSYIPGVSLIMPVFNGAQYLEAAIQSIIAQDFVDWELICVDDGSTDQSAAIMNRYVSLDSRIRFLQNVKNIGLPATLNCGFAVAQGDLHSWTSDDNILKPNMLSRLVGELNNNKNLDIVYAGYSVINETDEINRYVKPRPIEDRWFCNPVGAAFLYRREVTEVLEGYDVTLFGAEDYDFWMRAARHFIMRPIDEDLYLYRRHHNSLTNSLSSEIRQKVALVVERELQYVDNNQLRARAYLQMILSDWQEIGWLMTWRAFVSSPVETFRKVPKLIWHLLRVIWHRSRKTFALGKSNKVQHNE